MAVGLGITRVTDVTRLDRVGLPVYSGIRPGAVEGSLCVNAGKGASRLDAQIGAYMESIEFAAAEPGTAPVEVVLGTIRDVIDGSDRPNAILDFCPIARRGFGSNEALACVAAEEILGGSRVQVPAELVLLPYVGLPGTGKFGSNSNGLASGNDRDEAVLHGLLEVIERDTRSFHRLRDTGRLVCRESLEGLALSVMEQVERASLDVCLRWLPNQFRIPCYEAIIWDPSAMNSLIIAAGYGCHLDPVIAAVRAITEAAQSRLSWIHGGRDDLQAMDDDFGGGASLQTARQVADQFARYRADPAPVAFEETWRRSTVPSGIRACIDDVMDRLCRGNVRHVCVVPLTIGASPLQVVRVIVPRLEYLDRFSHRIGPRLHAFIRTQRD